ARRAHEAHVEHAREGDVGGEASAPSHQGRVLEPRHGTADDAHLADRLIPPPRSAAPMRCGVAGVSSVATPKGESPALTAVSTAAGPPVAPPSPSPLALVAHRPAP